MLRIILAEQRLSAPHTDRGPPLPSSAASRAGAGAGAEEGRLAWRSEVGSIAREMLSFAIAASRNPVGSAGLSYVQFSAAAAAQPLIARWLRRAAVQPRECIAGRMASGSPVLQPLNWAEPASAAGGGGGGASGSGRGDAEQPADPSPMPAAEI